MPLHWHTVLSIIRVVVLWVVHIQSRFTEQKIQLEIYQWAPKETHTLVRVQEYRVQGTQVSKTQKKNLERYCVDHTVEKLSVLVASSS